MNEQSEREHTAWWDEGPFYGLRERETGAHPNRKAAGLRISQASDETHSKRWQRRDGDPGTLGASWSKRTKNKVCVEFPCFFPLSFPGLSALQGLGPGHTSLARSRAANPGDEGRRSDSTRGGGRQDTPPARHLPPPTLERKNWGTGVPRGPSHALE